MAAKTCAAALCLAVAVASAPAREARAHAALWCVPALAESVVRLADACGTDVAADTAWTTGRLVFRDAPLGEVAGALRRWYGVRLRFADSAAAERHLTATFAGESTDAVLRVVGLATGVRLERRGDTVVVRAGRPSTEAAPSP